MKKKILSLVLLTVLVFFTGCTITTNNINKISYEEYTNKVESKESFILYIGEKNSALYQTLNQVLNDNNLEAFLINEKDLKDTELLEFRDKINYTGNTIVFIKEGIDPSTLSHLEDGANKTEILNSVINFGFIGTDETESVTE